VTYERRQLALVLSLLWTVLVFVAVGFGSMGDCAEPVERCMNFKHSVGLIGLAVYLVGLVAINWLLLRRRKR
jgi:uncharacterized membrane protein YphA (DoxX/SURF4 family)